MLSYPILSVHEGSILDVQADAIVNPANSFMRHDGGLAAVIHSAAQRGTPVPWGSGVGPAQKYLLHQDSAPLIPYGGAILGPPGALAYKGIIHAVGPIWGGGSHREYGLLLDAYDSALNIAENEGFDSIVFPAIGAGVFGCPIDVVAACAVLMCSSSQLKEITFAVLRKEHVDAFNTELAALSA